MGKVKDTQHEDSETPQSSVSRSPAVPFPPTDEGVEIPPGAASGGEAAIPFPPTDEGFEIPPGAASGGESGIPFPPTGERFETPTVVSFPPVQPAVGGQPTTPSHYIGKPWKTKLFSCHEDNTNAFMTAILPCVTFGQIAEVLDSGKTTCPVNSLVYLLMLPVLCTPWNIGSKYRTKLRNNYGLVEAPYQDLLSHILCPCCSLCQEYRELKLRNLHPGLGWNGIIAQQQGRQNAADQQINTPPPLQSMSM